MNKYEFKDVPEHANSFETREIAAHNIVVAICTTLPLSDEGKDAVWSNKSRYADDIAIADIFNNKRQYWAIYGDDPNVDLNGPHINPILEYVDGSFVSAIHRALTLPRFKIWGYGFVKKFEITRLA